MNYIKKPKFLNKIFKSEPITTPSYKMINELGNAITDWDGNLFDSDIIRGIIRPKVSSVGKMKPQHIRKGADNKLKVNPEPYMVKLLREPNPLMSMQKMIEKLCTNYMLKGNSYGLIVFDEYNIPIQIYPIPAVTTRTKYVNNILYLEFTYRNGTTSIFPYTHILHFKRDFYENDVFGTSQEAPLKGLMEIVNTTDKGLVQAVKTNAIIKWILKFNQVLNEDDVAAQTTKFIKNYLSIDDDSGGGAMSSDPRYTIEQVKPNNYVPSPLFTDKTMTRLYNFFNTNENIVQAKFTEDQWNAYYEIEIEPFAVELSNEFTRKLFNAKERSHGNSISFESSNLQFASIQTKLALVALVDRGAMSGNEWREVLGYAPVEGGDDLIRRLDTARINEKGEGDNGKKE